MPSKSRSLQTRFILGLSAIVLFLSLFFAISLYLHMRDLLYSEVSSKVNLVFNQVDAVQSYVRHTLRPKMYNYLSHGEFIIEAMSTSFVTRQVMDRMNETGKDHIYRRVAQNARNPHSELKGIERELYQWFKQNPGSGHWTGYKTINDREVFIKARPVVFKKSCMFCHGDPDDAPHDLLTRYGRERGFGHTVDELGGLDMVGVPLEGSLNLISEATLSYLILYLSGMVLLYLMIQLFFNRVVSTKLKRLSAFYRERFHDLVGPKVLNRLAQGDEVDDLLLGIEELGQNLHTARKQLQEHAETLEQRVDERTLELSHEVDERRNDVRLFVGLLDGLHQSDSIRNLLELALDRIARRFELKSIDYLCTFSAVEHYAWPDQEAKLEIPHDTVGRVIDGEAIFSAGEAFIPVSSYQEAVQGVLHMVWPQPVNLQRKDQEVILALGQQLGIAIENIRSLHDLLLQRDNLKAIFEGISDPMALLDARGRVLVANRAASELAGEPGEESKVFEQLMTSGGLGSAGALLSQVVQGATFTKEVGLDDGRVFRLTLYPLPEGGGTSGRIVAYVREITDEKRMMAQIQQNERLVSVGKLASGLAHEMNNPLGVILCYADLLDAGLSDDQSRADLAIIVRHAKQAQKVLSDLLNFARAKPKTSGPVEVGEVVKDIYEVFKVQAESRRCDLSMVLEELPHYIRGNRHSLEQILTNLLLNALDAVRPDSGRIKIKAKVEERLAAQGQAGPRQICITVSDNGPGIPPENLNSIFDPFFSTKDVGQGTGLGLAVVYGLIHDMQGSIRVENRDGAVFSLCIPLLSDEEMAA